MSVMLLGVASKPLIEAGLLRNSGSATTGEETVAPVPAIIEVGRTAPERPQAARDPATQAVIAAPATNQDRGPRIQERPAMKPSSLPTSRPAQRWSAGVNSGRVPDGARACASGLLTDTPLEYARRRPRSEGFPGGPSPWFAAKARARRAW